MQNCIERNTYTKAKQGVFVWGKFFQAAMEECFQSLFVCRCEETYAETSSESVEWTDKHTLCERRMTLNCCELIWFFGGLSIYYKNITVITIYRAHWIIVNL